MQILIDVDMRFQRQRRIQHCFHPFLVVLLQGGINCMRARRGLLQDVAACHVHEAGKQLIVLRKIRMAQHVRHH